MSKIIWAKLDPGFYSNRKIIRAGRNGREVFQFALCMNAQRGATGSIPAEDLEPWYVADQLRITEAEAQDGLERAVAAGLLVTDAGNVRIRGWGDDWARQTLSRAEIQANYRDRKEGKPERYQSKVTSDVTGNALPIREIREIRERDNGNALSPSDSDPRRPRKAPAAPQPLSSTWEPAQATAATVHSLGVDFAHELTQFRLNAAARGHLFTDPDAAFEQFARRSHDIGRAPKPKPKPGSRTSTPKPLRVRGEDGTLFEDDGHGGMSRVDECPNGTQSAQNSDQTANRRAT